MNQIRTRWLIRSASTDGKAVSYITKLTNDVYAAAEAGLWVEGTKRTAEAEIADLIGAGEIAVADVGHRTVGCVRIQRLDGSKAEFGMLAVDPPHRGLGAGRELIRFAEDEARREGATVMQLEVLAPRHGTHPSKEFLHSWYTRIGYELERIGTIDGSYPALAPLLATPCDYRIYNKKLLDARQE